MQPIAIDQGATQRHITQNAFWTRVGLDADRQIELASLDNPAGTLQERALAADLRVFRRRISEARYVDLDLPELRAALQQMEPLIPALAGRVGEILGAPVQPQERP